MVIANLLAPEAGAARDELDRASGVISMLIADEVTRDRALVVTGTGPQIRIYTVHGDDAVDGSSVSERPLSTVPTAGTWTLSVPVADEDAMWVGVELAGLPHIAIAEPVEPSPAPRARSAVPIIDLNELRS